MRIDWYWPTAYEGACDGGGCSTGAFLSARIWHHGRNGIRQGSMFRCEGRSPGAGEAQKPFGHVERRGVLDGCMNAEEGLYLVQNLRHGLFQGLPPTFRTRRAGGAVQGSSVEGIGLIGLPYGLGYLQSRCRLDTSTLSAMQPATVPELQLALPGRFVPPREPQATWTPLCDRCFLGLIMSAQTRSRAIHHVLTDTFFKCY